MNVGACTTRAAPSRTSAFVAVAGLIVLGALLGGCATPTTKRVAVDSNAKAREEHTQQVLAVRDLAMSEIRLLQVGHPILQAAASECGTSVRYSAGFLAASRDRVSASSRGLLSEALNLDNSVRVLAVYAGGGAEAAGLKVGDVFQDSASPLLAPTGGKESREAAARRLAAPIDVTVLRNGAPVFLTVKANQVCDFALKVVPKSEVNAFADGESIVVTRGMMRFAADDRELALVVGHELGHNSMGHLDKKKQNMVLGAVADIAFAILTRGGNTQGAFMNAGAAAYSQDFEAEADYVGLYYLARAGYDTQGAADFWRRMAVENPSSIKTNHSASHPATPERFLALESVDAEIRTKQVAGAPLVPAKK